MFRFRNIFLFVGSFVATSLLLFTDPDNGFSTAVMLMGLMICILAIAFAHIARKALTDYPESDMRHLFRESGKNPIGSGLALVALSIIFSSLLFLFGNKVHAAPIKDDSYIPVKAYEIFPIIAEEKKILARSSSRHRGRSLARGYNGGGPSVLDANAAAWRNRGAPTGVCDGFFNFGGAVAGVKMPFCSSQPDIAAPHGFLARISYFAYGLGQSSAPFEISGPGKGVFSPQASCW
jgi:hypothetical protein